MYATVFISLFLGAYGAYLDPTPVLPAPTLQEDIPYELVVPKVFLPGTSRIVGGVDVPEGSVPYQASLRNQANIHFCGGSILTQSWVLTAAHCTEGQTQDSITVVVGTTNRLLGGETYLIDQIIRHEDYNSATNINDISLLKVKSDIKFSKLVQPIALPTEDTGAGEDLFLSGWGSLSYPGTLPVHLQMINLTSLSVGRCQTIYKRINPVYRTQICSQSKTGIEVCIGDSGGPLVADNKMVGIVSWGMPCAQGYPSVYTRVSSFIDWIQPKIKLSDTVKFVN